MTAVDPIAQHVEEGPRGPQLRDSAVEIWVLVAQLAAFEGDPRRLATAYDLPLEAVEAALTYYRQHKALIDAQIKLNTA